MTRGQAGSEENREGVAGRRRQSGQCSRKEREGVEKGSEGKQAGDTKGKKEVERIQLSLFLGHPPGNLPRMEQD